MCDACCEGNDVLVDDWLDVIDVIVVYDVDAGDVRRFHMALLWLEAIIFADNK